MARLFQYIRPEQVAETWRQHREDLQGRPVVLARLGDLALRLADEEGRLALFVEDEARKIRRAGMSLPGALPDEAAAAQAAAQLQERMEALFHESVAARREQIWQWYIADWLEARGLSFDDFIKIQMGKRGVPESADGGEAHWPSRDAFLHGAYQDIGGVMSLIERRAPDETERALYRQFAAADIMELQQEQNRARLMAGLARDTGDTETAEHGAQTYAFRVEVDAASRAEAEDKLRRALRRMRDPDIRFHSV